LALKHVGKGINVILISIKALVMADFKKLLAYSKAFKLAMDIFEISKRFPKEEKYSLTDQIRRSSRSVCANFAEAYRRRKHPAHFLSKLADSDAENAETGVWLDFSLACLYVTEAEYKGLHAQRTEVGNLLGYMLQNPEKFC
jgi:four helix bundle protein